MSIIRRIKSSTSLKLGSKNIKSFNIVPAKLRRIERKSSNFRYFIIPIIPTIKEYMSRMVTINLAPDTINEYSLNNSWAIRTHNSSDIMVKKIMTKYSQRTNFRDQVDSATILKEMKKLLYHQQFTAKNLRPSIRFICLLECKLFIASQHIVFLEKLIAYNLTI